jgi:predicted Na+-dependent transporter
MLVTLAVPVAAGMIVRRRWTSVAERWRPFLQRAAFFGIVAILALVVLENPRAFAAEVRTTVPLASAFILCSMASGWAVAALVAPSRNDRFTIATEFATRNVGVATAIAVTLLGRVEFARFAATYFLTELPIMLAAVWIFVRRREQIDRLRPPADSRTRARG